MATSGRAPPPEVVAMEHILDKLATGEVSDTRTLSNCSLFCCSWLPRSSAHLLKSISVPARGLERYLDRVCEDFCETRNSCSRVHPHWISERDTVPRRYVCNNA